MTEIVVIAHNIRSTHNIGSIFRSAEGFGVSKIICSGYTPYPTLPRDTRLPHIHKKLTTQIAKTGLGAETLVPFEYHELPPVDELRAAGYIIAALEQAPDSIQLQTYRANQKIALILGEEVHGVPKEILEQCSTKLEIPMLGTKESFNVSVATGIALYQLRLEDVTSL